MRKGKVRPYLFAARKRGVIFDVGHGGGSFIFRQAAPAMQQGFVPDSISTDLHNDSMNAGMKDMLNVMSKFLNLGVSLDDVIRMSTSNPAHEIKHDELGNLSVGSDADVAVLRLEKGHFGFVDTYGARMAGNEKLICELTVRDGRVVWDLNGITREDWTGLGHYARAGIPGLGRHDHRSITQRVQPQPHSRPIWPSDRELESRRWHNRDRVSGPHPLSRVRRAVASTGRCPQLGGSFAGGGADASFCVGSIDLLFGMYMQSRTTDAKQHLAGCARGRTNANGPTAD